MNEILTRKYIKMVMARGVQKHMAVEIVESVMEMTKGKDMETYIDYAITLTYGYGFTRQSATK